MDANFHELKPNRFVILCVSIVLNILLVFFDSLFVAAYSESRNLQYVLLEGKLCTVRGFVPDRAEGVTRCKDPKTGQLYALEP